MPAMLVRASHVTVAAAIAATTTAARRMRCEACHRRFPVSTAGVLVVSCMGIGSPDSEMMMRDLFTLVHDYSTQLRALVTFLGYNRHMDDQEANGRPAAM